MTDAVILAQQIVTVAELNGLGSCYLGTVTYNPEEISRLLGLPELVVPVACVALGYPADGGVEPWAAVAGVDYYRSLCVIPQRLQHLFAQSLQVCDNLRVGHVVVDAKARGSL